MTDKEMRIAVAELLGYKWRTAMETLRDYSVRPVYFMAISDAYGKPCDRPGDEKVILLGDFPDWPNDAAACLRDFAEAVPIGLLEFSVSRTTSGKWIAVMGGDGYADTPALAMCKAFLQWKGIK